MNKKVIEDSSAIQPQKEKVDWIMEVPPGTHRVDLDSLPHVKFWQRICEEEEEEEDVGLISLNNLY